MGSELHVFSAIIGPAHNLLDPYGLGVAWGADLEPAVGEIMLTTRDHIAKAMTVFLG